MYWTGVLHVLDWCVTCTRLVCCMYWTGVLYVLDWCVVCTGLVCCMYWTGVFLLLYALDEYVVGMMYLLDCNVALWSLIQKPLIMGGCVSLVPESYMQYRGISY